MDENLPLSFIAAPAILTNACAILQNGATMRYNLAIAQWRDFRASLAGRDDRLSLEYTDPATAVRLAERRIRLQLVSLNLLNAAVALYAAATVLGLVGTLLAEARYFPAASVVSQAMMAAGGTGLLFLLAATGSIFFESACGRAMLGLHLQPAGALSKVARDMELSHDT
ncbi:hypothetical protein [Chelativorans sp.]|uniref:hypothetical protein n=1 Tax=Chelativorans sp. TaxID=2203393 RepID=UPI002811FD7B|nr:hypothetical protein [Chelativorans sp.]